MNSRSTDLETQSRQHRQPAARFGPVGTRGPGLKFQVAKVLLISGMSYNERA